MDGCIPRVWKAVGTLVFGALSTLCFATQSFAVTHETASLDEWAPLSGAGSGNGAVNLVATIRNSGTHGFLSVAVGGYPTGQYTVAAVTLSSGSTVDLGTMNVRGQNRTGGIAIFGLGRSPFPASLSPLDIATISLSDSNGSIVSTGTLTPVQHGFYNAVSPLVSSTTTACGYAMIRAFGAEPAITDTTPSNQGGNNQGGDGASNTTTGGNNNNNASSLVSGASLVLTGASTYTGLTNVSTGASQTWEINNYPGNPLTISGVIDGNLVSLTPGGTSPILSGSGELYVSNQGGEGGTFNMGTITPSTGLTGFTLGTTTGAGLTVMPGFGFSLSGGTLSLSSTFTGINPFCISTGTDTNLVLSITALPIGNSAPPVTIPLSSIPGLSGSSSEPVQNETPVSDLIARPAITKNAAKAATKANLTPITGEITIHAHGLPPNSPVLYATDTGTIGTADTDIHGNLSVTAFQGGTGMLPPTLDLYSIQFIAIEDTSGDVIITAGF